MSRSILGCTTLIILFLSFSGLYVWDHLWRSTMIPLPDGSGSVIFKAKQGIAPDPTFFRRIHFNTREFTGSEKWLPSEYPIEDSPINVYWYPKNNGIGPYLRFQDPHYECLADLCHGVTLIMVRLKDRSCYSGEISGANPYCYQGEDENGKPFVEVSHRLAKRLPDSVALKSGFYLGKIEAGYRRFIPAKESSEKKIETKRN